MQLILYTGVGCCLCEQAETLLKELGGDIFSKIQKVDVRSDSTLYHLYGARIPVLYRNDAKKELPWPFESSQLAEFLN